MRERERQTGRGRQRENQKQGERNDSPHPQGIGDLVSLNSANGQKTTHSLHFPSCLISNRKVG